MKRSLMNSKQLPLGWRNVRIGDICKTGAGGTPRKSNKKYYQGGTIPWLLSGEVSQGEVFESKNFITEEGLTNSSAKIFPMNTVLVAMYGATAGQVGILRCEAATNQAVCGIYPNASFLPEYIFYAVLSKQADLIATAAGNAQPNISQIKIKKTEISICPLPEQKRIVAILDEVFAGISQAVANAEKNLANARELFESYLNRVFTEKGEGWVEKKLGEIGKIQTGSTPKTSQADNFGDFIPFIKPADFYADGRLKYNNKGLSSKGLKGSRLIASGSVLMVCIGATIGKVGFCERDVTSNQQINALTPAPDVFYKLLYYQMRTSSFQDAVIYKSGQATLPIINKTKWGNLTIAFPVNQDEQQRIISRLDGLQTETQHLEIIYQKKLKSLTELKQSILQKAFTGELTADTAQQQVNV